MSRASWDPATTLFAIRGNSDALYTLHASGTNVINATYGTNVWRDNGTHGSGRTAPLASVVPREMGASKTGSAPSAQAIAPSTQAYLALAVGPDQIAAEIDAFLNKLPIPR